MNIHSTVLVAGFTFLHVFSELPTIALLDNLDCLCIKSSCNDGTPVGSTLRSNVMLRNNKQPAVCSFFELVNTHMRFVSGCEFNDSQGDLL